jgi:hypothetical protein
VQSPRPQPSRKSFENRTTRNAWRVGAEWRNITTKKSPRKLADFERANVQWVPLNINKFLAWRYSGEAAGLPASKLSYGPSVPHDFIAQLYRLQQKSESIRQKALQEMDFENAPPENRLEIIQAAREQSRQLYSFRDPTSGVVHLFKCEGGQWFEASIPPNKQ